MFVTNIVVGLVCIFRPFRLTRRPFLRDNIYYLFAVYWILFLLWDNKMALSHAIGNEQYNNGRIIIMLYINDCRFVNTLCQLCTGCGIGKLNIQEVDTMERTKG